MQPRASRSCLGHLKNSCQYYASLLIYNANMPKLCSYPIICRLHILILLTIFQMTAYNKSLDKFVNFTTVGKPIWGLKRWRVRDNVQRAGHCCQINPERDGSCIALKGFISQQWPASCTLSRLLHGYLLKKSIIWHKNSPPESEIRTAAIATVCHKQITDCRMPWLTNQNRVCNKDK